MNQLIIIDGNSLLFRAYFAMRPMVTSDGQHTQGIFAFVNMLNKIIADNRHDYICVAFDMKHPTFRHKMYPEYKAGRTPTPNELLSEIPILHEVLDAMNIKVVEMPGFEADDLIGTISKTASKEGISSLVVTGDKDELQLVDDNIKVLINKKGMTEFAIYDEDAMYERYSLTPTKFIDLKGLMGDKSDNIPGVMGVGEKKGTALLLEYGNLENIIEHADEIKGKLGENIRANKEIALMSKELATIKIDVPIDFTWEELEYQEPDYNRLIDIYTKLEFNSFITRIKKSIDSSSTALNDNSAYEIAGSIKLDDIKTVDYSEFIKELDDEEEVVIHINTDNNHLAMPRINEILLFSARTKLFTRTIMTPMNLNLCVEELIQKNPKLIAYDIKAGIYSLIMNGISGLNSHHDVKIAEYLIDPNVSKYSLAKMLLKHCGQHLGPDEDVSSGDTFDSYGIEDNFALDRLYFIYMVYEKQMSIIKENNTLALFRECEMPLVETIASMEAEGIYCDADTLKDIGKEIDSSIERLQSDIYELADTTFNINSPKQLGTVLFDQLQLPYPKAKGKSGYSTAAEILDKLEPDYKIVADVLEYRKLAKLKSTYIDGLIALIGDDNKIRPHFNQTVAATGRLSCTEPNLQNIPIRDDYGRLIRNAFVVNKPSNIFIGADYSQIELRVLASLSGDQNMIDAFRKGEDIHTATASRVFGIDMDKVTPLDRTKAKAVNFGVVYGMSGFGLSENLKISRKEAQRYIDEYFEKHIAVKEYLDELIEEGRQTRLAHTYFGRIRQINEFSSSKYMERELAKRLAMNTPIQGTAADIIKFAMNNVYRELKNRNLESKLILQIHDELIVEGPESEKEEVQTLVDNCMKSAADLSVELVCDIHSAKSWYDLK